MNEQRVFLEGVKVGRMLSERVKVDGFLQAKLIHLLELSCFSLDNRFVEELQKLLSGNSISLDGEVFELLVQNPKLGTLKARMLFLSGLTQGLFEGNTNRKPALSPQ